MLLDSEPPLILYHNDTDGFCAAFFAWLAFQGEGDYVSIDHGMDPPDVTGKDVYVLDFCFDRETTISLQQQARNLLVLDHHKTAQQRCGDLSCCYFDTTKSGVMLAFDRWKEHLHSKRDPLTLQRLQTLAEYVQDRDLWQWEKEYSQEISSYLFAQSEDFKAWLFTFCFRDWWTDAITAGREILAFNNKTIDRISEKAREVDFLGFSVLAVNSPVFQSELGNKLAEDRLFAVVWHQTSKGDYLYSLRSKTDFDVSELASDMGGGGHPQAAGFCSDEKLID